jgi:electron transfer flavoprotein beta subunit
MGPSSAIEVLKEALARGADEGILLTDARFAGADTLATSYTLASAIRMAGPFDLIICGEKTVDGDTAQVGPEVAEYLGIPHVAFVDEMHQLERDKIIVKSRMDRCYFITELVFPGLISVTKDINIPRLPTLKDKIRARRANITVWAADDLLSKTTNREFGAFGAKGSPTRVNKVYTPFLEKKKCKILNGSTENIADRLAAIILDHTRASKTSKK